MANFTVTANSYLRSLYTGNRNLVTNSERAKVSVTDRGKADTKALRNGISSLSEYDYDEEVDKDEEDTKFYKTLKAFADSYNNTIKTGGELSETDPTTKRLVKEMKKLKNEYGDELERLGISFDSKGYMSISSTAMDNISPKNYKDILGEDSPFMKDLEKLSTKLSRRINYLV